MMTSWSAARRLAVILCLACVAPCAAEPVSPRPALTNLAAGRVVTFDPPPNYPDVTDAHDAAQLTDGKLAAATPMWYDKATVGWVTTDPVVLTIDLGEHQPIRGLSVRMAGGSSGVEWPARINVLVSEAGETYSYVGDLIRLAEKKPVAQGYAAHWFTADGLRTHGRYVRLVITPTSRGGGSYVMLDEVEIYRGHDAWLKQPLASSNAPAQWQPPWKPARWTAGAGVPAGEMPVRVRLIDGGEISDDEPLYKATAAASGMTFTLRGEAGVPRRMTWSHDLPEPVSTENCRYAVLTFKGRYLRNMYEPFALVELRGMNDGVAASSAMLLDANAALRDGRSHTIVKELPPGFTLDQVRVAVVTESSHASLTLERLELVGELPAAAGVALEPLDDAMPAGCQAVALAGLLNENISNWAAEQMKQHGLLMDGATRLPPGVVAVSGVPFLIAEGQQNLAAMPASRPTDARVEFLGQMVDKRYLNPDSRHDTLSIAVDAKAREVMLLLALQAPPVQRRGGHTHAPLKLTDIESLSVELIYDRSLPELAFPYSLADKAPSIPCRGLGAYVVAADPQRTLKQVVLHNRHFGPNFAVAAVTLNTSVDSVASQLTTVAPPPVTVHQPEPAERAVSVTREGDRLVFSNRWYECAIDTSSGFVIDRLVSRWNSDTPITLAPSSGLRVRIGDTIYTGRSFKARIKSVANTQATLQLTSTVRSLPLELEVTVNVNDSPDLQFVTRATNRGDEAMTPQVSLPVLSGLALGEPAQTRLFFPQYRAVDTARNITLRAPYGPEFTQQFMAVYNRAAGVGLMVRTDNRTQQEARFALKKDDQGVEAGVHYTTEYTPLTAKAAQEFPPVSLTFHTGDWRDAMDIQRDWINSWYQPVHAQDKAFFRDAWDLMCYRTSDHLSWLESMVPPFINKERTRFLTAESFAFDEQTFGHVTDFIHFYNWTYNDKTPQNEYGVHGTEWAYAQVGGIEFFREGIREIQEDYGKPVSLYAVIDRARASALHDPELERYVVEHSWHQAPDNDPSAGLRASGVVDGIYYIPRGDDRWLDYAIEDVLRMQRDTGCKLVYLDVFTHWSHLGSNNGVSPRAADMKVLTALREGLPPDVVFWSEYSPTDFGSQWSDGSLTYYFLDLNETFARPYDEDGTPPSLYHALPMNAARFLQPRFKSIGLPVYIEASNNPSQVDALFVNAEAFQEDTWRLHHSRIRERLNRAYVVKHRYNDCFNTDRPSPQVDTAVAGIVANHFPGERRNVWTLFNGRPGTYDGVVLAVPHRDGATYYDAWNDKPLTPIIEDGVAKITTRIDPQQPGCVVQEWGL